MGVGGDRDRRLVVSGTVHMSYELGENIDEVSLKRETELYLPSAKKKRHSVVGRGGKVGSASSRSGITLADLVKEGILVPGPDKISVSYKGATAVASLTEDGAVEYESQLFQSATAFSIYFKRKITPSKQGDDGWKSVFYGTECLDHYRKMLITKRKQQLAKPALDLGSSDEVPKTRVKLKLSRK